MNLTSQRPIRRLKLQYTGEGCAASRLLYVPMRICQFEIVESWINPGKEILMMQVSHVSSETGEIVSRPVWTESHQLIRDIRGTESELPHYTKIRRDHQSGYLLWTQLNEQEKSILSNL